MERRLAAIFMADVVGFSRLMEEDEAGTLATLKERRLTILEPTMRSHGGRVVKVMGDGVLVEFASAVKAACAALDLQRRMAAANETRPAERPILLRVGLNLGDVIGEGADIYGEGVNLAARLEALASPGGICVSAKMHDEVRGKLECRFEDMGEQAVKNITAPVRAYRLLDPADKPDAELAGAGLAGAGPRRSPLALPDRPSIAVLPFQNMSGDVEQDYFADGMVEDITTALSRLGWLFVIARNSSFTYKGRAVDVKQVGRDLGVRYVLEGSVRKAGNRMRITGQLIDTATGTHLWAEHFDGTLADVFELQDLVTSSVVGTIGPRLEQAEMERVKHKPTESLDAHDTYLRAMACFYGFTRASNAEATELFRRAAELDPRFGAAYGMQARCYLQRRGFGFVADREAEIAETRRLTVSAAEFGREDAVALCAAGSALMIVVGDLDGGTNLLARGLAVDRNLAWGWHFKSLASAFGGDAEKAIVEAALSMRLSPQDPQTFAMQFATALGHFFARRFEEASDWAETAQRMQPRFFVGACTAAACAAMAGRSAEMQRAMSRVREINPDLRIANLHDLVTIKRAEDIALWAEGLRKAGLPE